MAIKAHNLTASFGKSGYQIGGKPLKRKSRKTRKRKFVRAGTRTKSTVKRGGFLRSGTRPRPLGTPKRSLKRRSSKKQ